MSMSNQIPIPDAVSERHQKILELQKEIIEIRRNQPPEEVQDYPLLDWEGRQVMLSELFGDKDDLIVVHNMGKRCVYCTLWADGFNGVHHHLNNRTSFVVVSPDEPQVQREFAESRNWGFRMMSGHGGSFIKDMGFVDKADDSYWPGVSAFKRENGKIFRVGVDIFGPGDAYCSVWPLIDLLPKGENGWEPQYKY